MKDKIARFFVGFVVGFVVMWILTRFETHEYRVQWEAVLERNGIGVPNCPPGG